MEASSSTIIAPGRLRGVNEPSAWSVGGQALPSPWAASLVAHVTAGTNTAAEQAAFIAEAHALIAATLHLPAGAPLYVIVNEVPATAWGYDGQTQWARRVAASASGSASASAAADHAGVPRSMRQMAGLPTRARLDAKDTALVLIDFQCEYAADGHLPLEGLGAAAVRAQRLADSFDAQGARVVHVHHVARAARGVPFAAEDAGVQPLPTPAIRAGHHGVRKHWPSAFHETDLLPWLREAGIQRLVMAGAMTHNCVDSTARAALHLGFEVLVAADACATRALPTADGQRLDAAQVHTAALAGLADRHALVLPVADLLQGFAERG